MKAEEKNSFVKLLQATSDIHGKILSLDAIDLYWEDLRGYEFEPVRQALRLHRQDKKSGKFMPKPAEILNYLRVDDRDNRSALKCYQLDCKEKVTHHMFDQNKVKRGFCPTHYIKYAPKSEIDKRIDEGAKQFEEEAKELGLTNQQYFRKKFNITDGKNNVEAITEAITNGRSK